MIRVDTDVIVAPVVETRGLGVRVAGHALRDFELAAVREVAGDAGGAEGMAADLRLNSLEPAIQL